MRDRAHPASSPLTMARERHLLALSEAGDRAATEELVTAFMPAINGVASLYRSFRSLVQMKRARAAFAQANRREPSDSELAETARMPLDQVQHLVSAERAPSSLQAPAPGAEEAATTLAERLADPATEEEYERIVDLADGEHIEELAAGLEERERRIVFAHYGIGCRQQTLREIGRESHLSAERVRQLEERALAKLRKAAAGPTMEVS